LKEFKVVPIRNGTVLDHIEPGKALAVLQALGYPVKGSGKVVSVAMNLPSRRGGLKDVIKFEDVEFSPDDVRRVQAVSARGTLNTIRNYVVAGKVTWGPVALARA
jgi:aspartate carbamoyltransferase regulatory subunit